MPFAFMTETWLWIAFAVIVIGILLFDLVIVGRQEKDIGARQGLAMVAAYAALAALFGIAVFVWVGSDAGFEFFTAYFLEQSLSLDNIFVWILIFQQLAVPDDARRKVLLWGILGAIVLRGVFIFAGAALIHLFEWLLYLFGAAVIVSGVRLLRSGGGKQHDVGKSRVLAALRRHLDITRGFHGKRFFVRAGGHVSATPLFVALIVVETTDVVFALDSIPAIFGVTRDPFVVYTSNIFAVLGLRAMFFLVEDLVERLHYLRYGLALLLVFIGLKMIAAQFVELPTWATLVITLGILAGSIAVSLLRSTAKATN
jgi:tellurite resistance protein TerC